MSFNGGAEAQVFQTGGLIRLFLAGHAGRAGHGRQERRTGQTFYQIPAALFGGKAVLELKRKIYEMHRVVSGRFAGKFCRLMR